MVVEFVCANVIEPLLYGSGTGVTPLAILASAVFWTWLWGGAGLLLSTPLTVCLAVIGRHVPRLRFLDLLLGDDPVLAPCRQPWAERRQTGAEATGTMSNIQRAIGSARRIPLAGVAGVVGVVHRRSAPTLISVANESASLPMSASAQLIACHDCDLLHRRVPLPPRGVGRCTRCGATL